MWTVTFSYAKEVWNVFMISFWEGGGKGRSYEIGSNHPSIKEKQEWTRQLSSIKIDEDSDEVESIADMMLREVES